MVDGTKADGAKFVDNGDPSGLDTALTLVSSLDATALSGGDLAVAVLQAERLLNAVHALSAVLLERFEQDAGWAEDGALSAASWTASRTGSARAALRSRRRQGTALAQLPQGGSAGERRSALGGASAGGRRLRPPPPRAGGRA